MSALQAIPTPHGIEILNSELKNTVTKYQLVGALTHDAAAETLYTFHTATIETSYYDENGVLTFILNLPIELHFDEYLHRIDVLDSQNQAVIECPTPKIALAKGIGGMVTLKVAIKGQAGDVVFKHGEYVTEVELKELYFPPIYEEINKKENSNNAATNQDIDTQSQENKHIKLPQFWRALAARVASQDEVNAGVDDKKTVTPKKLTWGVSYHLNRTGYLALPSWLGGVKFQWGYAGVSQGVKITFPMAFDSGCWSVQTVDSDESYQDHEYTSILHQSVTNTGFNVNVSASGGCYWMAVGK